MRKLILNTDSYKTSHWLQYPPGTTHVSAYIESRSGKTQQLVFFGLQAFIKAYLLTPITAADIEEAEAILSAHGLPFNRAGWQHILDVHGGYLPLKITALREGMVVPLRTPLVQVQNTDPAAYWLTSYIETALLRAIWYPTTVATNSREVKKIIAAALEKSSAASGDQLSFKLHDFGARGATTQEAAALGGMAHLINFAGTDTLAGLMAAREFYGADMPGFSIPAAEHSTMTAWGPDREAEAYANMIAQFGGEGRLFAVVSDSYDIYHAVTTIWGEELKEKVQNNGGTLVVRPDSGDPKSVVLDVLARLEKAFGAQINAKGYKVLPDYIRLIQGDGVTPKSIRSILEAMLEQGFAADNIAFGMGGALLQDVDRGTYNFAMKASAVKIKGRWQDVFKDPITDQGKRSKRGRQVVMEDFKTVSIPAEQDTLAGDMLETVYLDGRLVRELSFEEVRENARL